MKCKACKSVFEVLESQPRKDLQGAEDKKTGRVRQTKKHESPSRLGYRKMGVGKTIFSVKQYTKEKTWGEALEQCHSDGGSLVNMNTRQKYRLIARKYTSFKPHWIGLKDLYDNDTYFWTDGTPLTLKKWQKGQPSNRSTAGKEQNCVDLSMHVFNGQGWNDQRCEKLVWFICAI